MMSDVEYLSFSFVMPLICPFLLHDWDIMHGFKELCFCLRVYVSEEISAYTVNCQANPIVSRIGLCFGAEQELW